MADEKDRYGDKMKLVERAKEDIYFAERDREIIDKLKERLKKVEKPEGKKRPLQCPKCQGELHGYLFMGIQLDRCQGCGGVWFDPGELDAILKKVNRGPLASLVDRLLARGHETLE
ncbi:MAG TPA: zf-TFIIB domain-containing protein [Candidatus Binatia bacterium]